MTSITTKTGDNGLTTFIKNIRVPKDSPIMNCLGDIDELNCALGLIDGQDFIQEFLIKLSGHIIYKNTDEKIITAETKKLEKLMKDFNVEIPNKFIIPKGNINLARAICRRAERSLVTLDNCYYDRNDIKVCIQYLNRLSDYLYMISLLSLNKEQIPRINGLLCKT